ncbi:hypothetical protein JOD31_000780 [Methylopila capsulata]|uniref:Uncharacterized protein n=1 Tax=Methylopila capsulata TaxID=61654 RepID=A0ABS2T331_9HYPH|nr:hypothetical protein [Methylopila capsulata]
MTIASLVNAEFDGGSPMTGRLSVAAGAAW